jgi:nudix-type nucleoside diphosphatase, YffH/AdpP family
MAEPVLSFDDVDVVGCETRFQGYFRIDAYRLRHRLFDGGWSEAMNREIFERGQAVAIVLYDPTRDVLVLIEQFRPGVLAAVRNGEIAGVESPWLIEIVAGIIGAGEAPDEVARREAMEEAGCSVGDLQPICRIFASPGGSSETVALYFAIVDAPDAGGVHGLDHEHEDIRVLLVNPDEMYRWIDGGRIINGPALIGLQWFRLNEARFRPAR